MRKLNRRDVLRSAAGAAVVGSATLPQATTGKPAPRRPATTRRAAMAAAPAVPEANLPCLAMVEQCRSWSREVYLVVDGDIRGYVEVGAEGMAIAAACQAQGRPAAVRYWGHEPQARRGLGAFAGALLALELHDLPLPAEPLEA